MAAPTPVSALVHSSTLVTAGVYLIIRYYSTISVFRIFSYVCLLVGMLTCFMASMSASFETDLKKIIALSTLSQLGVMVISLGMAQPLIAFFHLITHAMFKALLFMCAGDLIHSSFNNQDVRLMGNVSSVMPLTSVCFNVANLSLCGIPFLSGFYSKDTIVEFFFMSKFSCILVLFLLVRVFITSYYRIKLRILTMWSPYKGPSLVALRKNSNNFTCLYYYFLSLGGIMMGCVLS